MSLSNHKCVGLLSVCGHISDGTHRDIAQVDEDLCFNNIISENFITIVPSMTLLIKIPDCRLSRLDNNLDTQSR